MNNNEQNKTESIKDNSVRRIFHQRRAVSPILATVILLGVSVVGGGLVFAIMSGGVTTAASQNIITVENAQGISGSDHIDATVTVKNGGSSPWDEIEVNVSKTALSEPLLYESLHEVAIGDATAADGGTDGTYDGEPTEEEVENPLRVQWIASLDKTSGEMPNPNFPGPGEPEFVEFEDNVLDEGEGIGVGRKFVAATEQPDDRNALIYPGTAVHAFFVDATNAGFMRSGESIASALGATTCDITTTSSDVECTDKFLILDGSMDGEFYCSGSDDGSGNVGTISCRIFTHQELDEPLGSGASKFFYADAFTEEVPGLGNQITFTGDNLVANIAVIDADGNSARFQTVLKVSGSS